MCNFREKLWSTSFKGCLELLQYIAPVHRKKSRKIYTVYTIAIVYTVLPILSHCGTQLSSRILQIHSGRWDGGLRPDAKHTGVSFWTPKLLCYHSGGARNRGKQFTNRGNLFTNSGTPWLVALALPTLELWITCG